MSEIDGLVVEPLKRVENDRGHLMEVCSSAVAGSPVFAQVYVTFTRNGVVKAWYRHHKQIDQIAVLSGAVKVVACDSREASPTFGRVAELSLDDESPALVRIPPGLWHGFQAVAPAGVTLIHVNSEPYRESAHDEEQIPANSPLIPYTW